MKRNKIQHRILGRTADHRKQLMQNLTSSLLEHGFVVTTEAKAKELRRHVEPLITRAKQKMTLSNRRRLTQKLMHETDLDKLIDIAQQHVKRPGGYLRLTRMPSKRTDNASLLRVDVINDNV